MNAKDKEVLKLLNEKLAKIEQAIDVELETGERYRIESGASRRETQKAPLSVLFGERDRIRREIDIIEGNYPRPSFVQVKVRT